jgi:hypothetical protein
MKPDPDANEVAPDEVDQVLDAIGHWGRWQRKMFFLVGIFLIPGTFHVLVLTFINANQVCHNFVSFSKCFNV